MNLNKNNIKYYFSENKMKQMIENLQQNLENDEEVRISIEKYRKDSKPQSAKNRLLSLTGTNSTNQSLKNDDKLTNNISDIDNNTIKKQKTKLFDNSTSQKESENSFDSLKFNDNKIKKKNTFYQFHSKHSHLANLYLQNNNATIDYIPFNKKIPSEITSHNITKNNLNIQTIDNSINIYNNNNSNNLAFNNYNRNINYFSSIRTSHNSLNYLNKSYQNFPIIRPTKSKINKTQRIINLPAIHSKLTNKSYNSEIIENSIKSDNGNKINLFLEPKNNKKIKRKKTNLFKDLRENNYSPVFKKKKYEKFVTLSFQKKRRSLESKKEINIETQFYKFNIDMNKKVDDNYIDENVNKKILDYFEKNLDLKNKEININKNNKCVSLINKKIDLIFFNNEQRINNLEQKITNILNEKLIKDQNLLNKKLDYKIENIAFMREKQILYYNYIKTLNNQNEINNELYIKQNIKEYILNNYYDIIEDIFNYCYKTNKNKKHAFNSYVSGVVKINKIKVKKLHSLTFKNFELNHEKNKNRKNDIKNLYIQALLNIYNKTFLEHNVTRDINHQLYKKEKFINFVETIKKLFPVARTFNKKVTLHKNSMNHFYKQHSKQIKSQFSHQVTLNPQFSKTSPNLILNNKVSNPYKKIIYSNLNMNEIIKTYEKKKSYKLNKETFNDSIIKNILNSANRKKIIYKSNFDIDTKETYSNNNILIPEFTTEKNNLINKEIEIFSSSNKYITKIQTEKIKSEELSNLGEDILKIIEFYIKDNNEILVIKIIKDYLEFINLNYKNKEGLTLLLLSIKHDCSEKLISFLLEKGADPNIYDVRILYNFKL